MFNFVDAGVLFGYIQYLAATCHHDDAITDRVDVMNVWLMNITVTPCVFNWRTKSSTRLISFTAKWFVGKIINCDLKYMDAQVVAGELTHQRMG